MLDLTARHSVTMNKKEYKYVQAGRYYRSDGTEVTIDGVPIEAKVSPRKAPKMSKYSNADTPKKMSNRVAKGMKHDLEKIPKKSEDVLK